MATKNLKEWSAEMRLAAIGAVLRLPIPWYVAFFLIIEIIEHGRIAGKLLSK